MDSNKRYFEDDTHILPVITGGPIGLGDLWNCQNSKRVGFNLFGKTIEPTHINVHPINESTYNLIHLKNSEDKLKLLKIDGELKLEIMCGLLKCEGSGNFDDEEKKEISEENLSCRYDLMNYSVSMLPGARESTDPHLSKMLLENKIRATHVVKTVIIGAIVDADIRIKQTKGSNKKSIGGKFKLNPSKLFSGAIDASVKAKLKKLDESESENYEKKIRIYSKPSVNSQPTTFEDMFIVIENIKDVIREHVHYKFVSDEIRGVPISFELVPIEQFLDIKIEKLYQRLKDDVIDDYQSILIDIMNYRTPNWLKNQILQNDSRLIRILSDERSPLTAEITKFESSLKKKAEKQSGITKTALQQYKNGEVDTIQLMKIIKEFRVEFDDIEIKEKISSFSDKGISQLMAIHESDATEFEDFIIFFTNHISLEKWFNSETNIKILLSTKGDEPKGESIFKRLFNISKSLNKLNIEIGIALPSISDDFSLKVKVNENIKHYECNDISYVISLLGVTLGIGNETEVLFHKLNASLYEISLPLSDDKITDINELIDILSISKTVYISKSKIDTIQKLKAIDNKWNFFIPIEARFTALEAVRNLRNLLEKQEFAAKQCVWFIGSLDTVKSDAAPILIAIYNGKIQAVCFDYLDIMIFIQLFTNLPETKQFEKHFQILSGVTTKKSFYFDRIQYVIELTRILNPRLLLKVDENQYKMHSFDEQSNEKTDDMLKLLKTLDSGSTTLMKLLNRIAENSSEFNHFLQILPNTERLKVNDWISLKSSLSEWLQKQEFQENENLFELRAILSANYFISNDDYVCIDSMNILKMYFQRLGNENDTISNGMKNFLKKKLIQQMISFLYENSKNLCLKEIIQEFNQISELDSNSVLLFLENLQKLDFLNDEQWDDIWLSEKIKYLVELSENDDRIIDLIASVCIKMNNFPEKFSEATKSKLKTMIDKMKTEGSESELESESESESESEFRGGKKYVAVSQPLVFSREQKQLVELLKTKGVVKSSSVENALLAVDRKLFCSNNPYTDQAKSIGFGTTISAPHIHGFILELLESKLSSESKVLDIGSGSGYLTICMGQMVGAKGRVIGIDHVKELIFRSQENLEKNFSHLSNRIKFVVGEGREGFLSEGPYDVINIGGAVTEVSQPILNQLKTGGRLIAPIGPSNDTQELTTIDKLQSGSLKRNCHLKVIFGSIKSLKSQIED